MSSFIYNPDRKSKEQLVAEFVVRTELLDEIMQDLESSEMKTPEQHYLVVGQRGTGKTTLLNRIKYATEDSKKLNEWLIPVIFTEEQYNISELANLWESIADNLEDYFDFSGITAEMEKYVSGSDFEEKCYDTLEKNLNSKQKKIVLLLDNFGDFLKKLSDVEIRRLREILQTKPHIRLIAGSPFYLESILDYKQPLFEFFKVKRLDGLNQKESKKLLLKLGDVYNEKEKIERIINDTPERIETLRILTGGVPRTIALMFRIFIDHEHESSLKDLERVLDAVTPLYKHRMDDLPAQQQKIIDAVARNWDAISVKELKERTRLESKIISAQLRQLEKNQIIEKRTTGTKNHLYLLKERFWNIWYLMRYGRKTDSERVIWLVRFLESWCSLSEIENRISDFVTQTRNGFLDIDTQAFYGRVYSLFQQVSPQQKYLLKENIPKYISATIELKETEILAAAGKFEEQQSFFKALQCLESANKLSFEGKKLAYEVSRKLLYNKKDLFFEYFDISTGKDYDVGVVPDASFVFLLFSMEMTIKMDLNKNIPNHVVKTVDLLINVFNGVNAEDIDFEMVILSEIILVLLAYGSLNMANKFFGEIKTFKLKERLKPVYYLYLYYQNGPNDSEYLKIGSEMKSIVSGMKAGVDSYRKLLKENLVKNVL